MEFALIFYESVFVPILKCERKEHLCCNVLSVSKRVTCSFVCVRVSVGGLSSLSLNPEPSLSLRVRASDCPGGI